MRDWKRAIESEIDGWRPRVALESVCVSVLQTGKIQLALQKQNVPQYASKHGHARGACACVCACACACARARVRVCVCLRDCMIGR